MDSWNAIGLILTFCGTALAFWQAYKAKSYRDEIQSDRQKLILIELMPIAKKARDECKKITTPVHKPMRGVDSQKIVHEVQGLAEKLQEYSHRLSGEFGQKDIVEALKGNITEYIAENNQSARYKIADKMYSSLNSIIESLSTSIDKKV